MPGFSLEMKLTQPLIAKTTHLPSCWLALQYLSADRCATVTISDRTEATLAAPLDTAERAVQAIKQVAIAGFICIVWIVVKPPSEENRPVSNAPY